MTGFQQQSRKGGAHLSQADESDFHAVNLFVVGRTIDPRAVESGSAMVRKNHRRDQPNAVRG
jgi:hypothetical protein